MPESRYSVWLLRFLAVLVAYYAGGRIGLTLPYVGSHISLIWPPTGIALAALLRWNTSLWPAVWLGAFGVNLAVGSSIEVAAGIACGNTFGPWLAARLLRGWDFDCDLPRRRDLTLYLIIGVAGGMAINATNGIAQLWLADIVPTAAVGGAWLTWWLGDAMGTLVMGIPLLTASRQSWRILFNGDRGAELGAVLLLTLATGAWLFHGDAAARPANPLLYLPFFLLSWLAIRGSASIASTAALLISTQAVWATAMGGGPFNTASVHAGLAMLWGYMATATVITVLLTVLVGELRASERRLTLATMGGHLGLWEWHLPSDKITYSGDFRALLGIAVEDLGSSQADWLRLTHQEDRPAVEKAIADHLAEKAKFFEVEFRVQDGPRLVWVEVRGQVVERDNRGSSVRMAGTMLNVSARRQAEEALRASEERWKFALEGAQDGVWDWHLETGKLYLSEREMALLGYPGEDGTHSHIDVLLERQHPDDRAGRQAALERYFAGEAPLFTYEFRARGRDGSWRWLLARGMVVGRAADGKPLRMIGTHSDISARKHNEQARQRQLISLQALNEIGAIHYASLPDELSAVLAIGAKHFGLELGIVSQVKGDTYTVVAHASPPGTLSEGQSFALGTTYCELTLLHDGVLAIPHMASSPYLGHPCYQAFKLEAYIGTPLRVAGAVFGTLNFSAASPYERLFDERDEEFILLLARWVSAAIERHQAQELLAESEAKLRSLFELSPLGIVRTDLSGHFMEFNKAFLNISGYAEEELKALDYWMLTPPNHADDEQCQLQTLERTGNYGPHEMDYIRKDGSLVSLQLNGLLVTGRDGQQYIWSIIEDITERKRADERLRDSEARYRSVINSVTEVIFQTDALGAWTFLNPAWTDVTGFTVPDSLGKPFLDYVHPDDRAETQALFESLIHRQMDECRHEIRYVHRNGGFRWIEVVARLTEGENGTVGTAGILNDMTQRREAEERLALSLKGADLAMTDWDIPSDQVIFGDGWTQLLGYQPQELNGSSANLAGLLRPDDAPLARDVLIRHLKGETPYLEAEVRMRHKDGHWVWVLARGRAVERSADGRAVRVTGTGMDISTRKQAESEIQRLSRWNELLLNSAGEGIYGVDGQGLCTFINPAALAMLGFQREEVIGKNPHALFHHHDADGKPSPLEDCPLTISLRDGIRREAEDTFIRKHGEIFPVSMTSTPLIESGQIVGAEVVFQDIGKRKAMEQELVRLATTDPLTGVANRRRFLAQLEMELARITRFERPASLLMLDIDHFKVVNDTYGHAIGDEVLKHFAASTQQRLRRIDLFGRLGGEEFAILLTGTDGASAFHFADELRRNIAALPAQTTKGDIPISVSIGVAEFDPADPSPDSLLARADVALYRAKAGGRNRVEAT